MPPAGPQGQSSDELAAMRHENASLKRRMAGFEQQIDQLKAAQASQRDTPPAPKVDVSTHTGADAADCCVYVCACEIWKTYE
jgi:hypothetical protein